MIRDPRSQGLKQELLATGMSCSPCRRRWGHTSSIGVKSTSQNHHVGILFMIFDIIRRISTLFLFIFELGYESELIN